MSNHNLADWYLYGNQVSNRYRHSRPGTDKISVDMFKLEKEDFIDGVQDIVSAGDFMDITEGAQIIFI